MNFKHLSLYVAVAVGLLAASCTAAPTFRQEAGTVWGTTYHITYEASADLTDSILSTMRAVELSLSAFEPKSTLSRINAGTTTEVDSMFAEVYKAAYEVYTMSRGAFDPTVGPLVDLWGFGHKGRDMSEPDSAAVRGALQRVGMSKSRLAGTTLITDVEGMEFDFAAIAKGYGVDCVARMLGRNGCDNYMVEIGGEVTVAGHNSTDRPWHIQIDAPTEDPGGAGIRVLEMTSGAVATSGNYRNYRARADGSRFGHTISPFTGYPIQTSIVSATVRCDNCMMCDALATACMAMGVDDAVAMLDSIGGTGYVLAVAEGDSLRIVSRL